MTFRMEPTQTGAVLFYRAFLHAADKTACLLAQAPGGALQAGTAETVAVVFDEADTSGRCRTPGDLRDLAFNVEGTVEVASRQEWSLAYRLLP
jgi:hypothetical protein